MKFSMVGERIRGRSSEQNGDGGVVRTRRGEGCPPALDEGKEQGVGKGKIDNRRVGISREGEPSVHAWGIEKGKTAQCRQLEVGSGSGYILRRERAERISQGVVDVQVTHHEE